MEIEITNGELRKGLGLVQGITERRNTMPILSHVLLFAEGSRLSLTATDLDVGMTVSADAKVKEKGTSAVPGRKLFEIIKELPEDAPVRMETKENFWVEIHCHKSRFKLSGLNPDDFPTLPHFEEMEYGSIEGDALHDVIEKTIFAVSQDEVRKNLNGVYVEAFDGNIRMVATDGHRLVYADSKGTITGMGKKGPLISRKGLMEMKKIIEEGEKQIGLSLTPTALLLKGDKVSFFTRLLEGEFPDYKMVIPKEGKQKVCAQRNDLLTSLRRVSVIMGGKSPAVMLSLKKGVMQFSSVNPEIGEAKDEVAVDYGGEDMDIGMNARYFIEPLSVIKDEEVLLEMTDESSPVVVRKKSGKDYISVIMPLKIT